MSGENLEIGLFSVNLTVISNYFQCENVGIVLFLILMGVPKKKILTLISM